MSEPGTAWAVLVWDSRRPRRPVVGRAVARCGAAAQWVDELSTAQQAGRSPRSPVALVALGECPSPDSLDLEVIALLKQKGFTVLAYGHGVAGWPIGKRCLALLAGALCLLDAAEATFPQELCRRLAQLLETEARRCIEEQRIKQAMKDLGVVGESAAMIAVYHWLLRVSVLSDVPALITGETGTGKELVARALHRLDPKRHHGPFVAVNCGALSAGLAESALFGHRRGAFTGADQDRRGLFRAAHGGVLFLDEVAEMEAALQVKLLRALQESRVLGLGEEREVAVDVRVIAATNRDLGRMVEAKEFRADLYHRLNVLTLNIPPLRERSVDLKPLVEHFLARFSSLAPDRTPAVNRDFIEALAQVELPGNARQVENLLRQALVAKADATPLTLSDLPPELWRVLSQPGTTAPAGSTAAPAKAEPRRPAPPAAAPDVTSSLVALLDAHAWNLSRTLKHCERLLLDAALDRTHGNQARAAQLLGVTPRSVYNKLHKHQRSA